MLSSRERIRGINFEGQFQEQDDLVMILLLPGGCQEFFVGIARGY